MRVFKRRLRWKGGIRGVYNVQERNTRVIEKKIEEKRKQKNEKKRELECVSVCKGERYFIRGPSHYLPCNKFLREY